MRSSLIEILGKDEVKLFMKNNSNSTSQEIILKYSGKSELPIKEIAVQIECRKRAEKKLPSLNRHNLLYKKVSLEQASSELTAAYKSSRIEGKRIIDLTGGLGIDSIYFAKNFTEVFYCEVNKDLSEIAGHNFSELGIKNIDINIGDGIEFLKKFKDDYFDWIYADPSRREGNNRSVDIKFHSPDILGSFELLKSKTKNLCIKLAPAFDINEAFKLFPELNEFVVVSANNECKEVLLLFNFEKKEEQSSNPTKSAAILNEKSEVKFYKSGIDEIPVRIFADAEPNLFFYEPDTAIRKAGLSEFIAQKFKLRFINSISDYMVSKKAVKYFPGRIFKIVYRSAYNAKEIKKYLNEKNITKANISRSNFALKPDEIKKTLKLKDGGNNYLFFTKDGNGKKIFVDCLKLN
jgi:hypothetical protein